MRPRLAQGQCELGELLRTGPRGGRSWRCSAACAIVPHNAASVAQIPASQHAIRNPHPRCRRRRSHRRPIADGSLGLHPCTSHDHGHQQAGRATLQRSAGAQLGVALCAGLHRLCPRSVLCWHSCSFSKWCCGPALHSIGEASYERPARVPRRTRGQVSRPGGRVVFTASTHASPSTPTNAATSSCCAGTESADSLNSSTPHSCSS